MLLDVLFAVLAVSGLALGAVIAERERAKSDREQLIREQTAVETRLRLAAIVESSNDAIFSKDLDGIVLSWNAAAQRIFGFYGSRSRRTAGGNSSSAGARGRREPAAPAIQSRRTDRSLQNDSTDESRAHDQRVSDHHPADGLGRHAWWASPKSPAMSPSRIGPNKALSSLSRRLIHAQEEERARIARELHDDIGQRLALLAIELTELSVSRARSDSRQPGRSD